MSLKDDIRFLKTNGFFPYPRLLQIEITTACPLQCPQCYKDDLSGKHIDFDFLKNLVVDAAENGATNIMINGGEPLLYPHFIEYIYLLHSLEIQAHCFSSGLNLTGEHIQVIKKAGSKFRLSISLNGSTKKINELSRDGYEIAVDAIKKLKESGCPFGIHWVARHDNIGDFPSLLEFARSNRARWVNVIANKLTGNKEIVSPMTPEDFRLLSDFIKNYGDKEFINVQFCFTHLNTLINNQSLNKNQNICSAGLSICCIDAEGNYMPCTHLLYKEKATSVKDYWLGSKTLQGLRQIDYSSLSYCNDCSRSNSCRFCRALSPATHDDFTVGLEQCPIRENH